MPVSFNLGTNHPWVKETSCLSASIRRQNKKILLQFPQQLLVIWNFSTLQYVGIHFCANLVSTSCDCGKYYAFPSQFSQPLLISQRLEILVHSLFWQGLIFVWTWCHLFIRVPVRKVYWQESVNHVCRATAFIIIAMFA